MATPSPRPIKHLLRPKEYRVYCTPNRVPDKLAVTNEPSKATCASCLSAMRQSHGYKKGRFKVVHTRRKD